MGAVPEPPLQVVVKVMATAGAWGWR